MLLTSRRPSGPLVLRTCAAVAIVGAALVATSATAVATSSVQASASRTYEVGVADYTLGDTAFTYPHLDIYHPSRRAPIEITGRVYYPVDASHGAHPMVILLHGSWQTCADRAAADAENGALAAENVWAAAHPGTKDDPGEPNPDQAMLDAIIDKADPKLNRWPCAKGTPPIPSYQGFDYLARSLARHGIMAVSISANGINAVGLGDVAVRARAALINKHLALWAQLDRTGGGPLAGHFTAAGTQQPVSPQFKGSVDLSRVGTLGHSRGGKAVFWQAADTHRKDWPAGVSVRATVSLAPEGAGEVEPGSSDVRKYLVTHVPFLAWIGTCDAATGTTALDYVGFNAGHNLHQDYLLTVRGANHNFLNQQWSPSSHQVEANDDIDQLGVPRPVSGHCTERSPQFPLDASNPQVVDGQPNALQQVSEGAERAVATRYLTAFFELELEGRTAGLPLLIGHVQPLANVADTVETVLPAT